MINFDDLLDELDAEFDQPKPAIQPSKEFDKPTIPTLKDAGDPINFSVKQSHPHGYTEAFTGTTSENPIPKGLAEAQEMNGVADHGLGKKLFKGDFKKTGPDRVEFIESLAGAFSIPSKTDLIPSVKDLLDRRFPGLTYWNGDKEIYIAKMKAQPEAINETPIVKAYEAYLNVKKGHTPYKTFRDEIYPSILAEREEAAIIPEAIGQNPMTPEESFKTEPISDDTLEGKGWALPETACHTEGNEPISALPTGFDIEPLKEEPAQPTLFDQATANLKKEIKAKFEELSPAPFTPPTSAITPLDGGNIWVAIDPGKDGAIVAIDTEGTIISKNVIPKIGDDIDATELCDMLLHLNHHYKPTVVLEDVHSLFGMAAATNFSMGHTLGIIEGVIAVAKIKKVKVAPKTWQKEIWHKDDMEYKAIKEGQKKASVDTKQTSMKAAHRLFPGEDFRKSARSRVAHDGICDAVLMAEFGRRKNL